MRLAERDVVNQAAMEQLILFSVLSLPPVLLALLRRTPLYWLPGAALIGLGFAAFGSMPDTSHDEHGLNALAAGVMWIAGMGCSVYGLACLWIGHRLHRPAGNAAADRPPPPVELPPAIVVNDATKT